jgi:hypothetical protein
MLESNKIVPLQVAKWVKIPLLVDVAEMEDLILNYAPAFKIYDVQRVTDSTEGIYQPEDFLQCYGCYVNYLKARQIPPINEFRTFFSAAWSVTDTALYTLPASNGRRLLKASKPVVQSQVNQIRYAQEDKVFRTQVFSNDSISWGIQLGFPHLFMDPQTYAAEKTRTFPNMALFTAIQKWIRNATIPTPFLANGEKINSPIRLGKSCLAWISHHPQLKEQGISIDRA